MHLNSGQTYLLSVSVLRMLTVEASLLVTAGVHHVAVTVAVKTPAPAFAVAVAANHSTYEEFKK